MIRVERRLGVPRWLPYVVPVGSLVAAAVITAIVLLLSRHNPVTTYQQIYQSAFVSPGAMSSTFVYATPLLFTGLCAAVAFRMKVWNIGGEGQLYMGAVGASGAGLALAGLPAPVILLAMVVAGMLAGAVWSAIPGLLRAFLRTNEILTSLMLNYVAGLFLYYLIYDSASYWRDLSSPSAKVFPVGKNLEPSAAWPAWHVAGLVIPMGFLVGVGVAGLLLGVIKLTRMGFEMRVIGEAPAAARYAGMRTRRAVAWVMAASGAFAGLGGASQIGDFGHVLDPRGLQQASYGYTGIVVAALARYNPLAVVVVSFLIGALTNAGFALQGPQFPAGLVGAMEGIILFSVLAGEVLARYRVVRGRPSAPPSEPGRSGVEVDRAEGVPGQPVGEVAP
ncbi:MAG TPA: ABC transporter permease [Nocardioidaceae bacterium]|nr:ABC transporter permease [Nocardioidaceae bacterium]